MTESREDQWNGKLLSNYWAEVWYYSQTKQRTKVAAAMSQGQSSLPQNKEAQLRSYQVHLKDNIRAMFDNFSEIMKLARVSEKIEEDGQLLRATQIDQDHYEMQVRAANIVKAGESLMKLVSDLKQFLILNDFPSVNESINYNAMTYKDTQSSIDKKLMLLRDDMAQDLYELEEEYYSSVYKWYLHYS